MKFALHAVASMLMVVASGCASIDLMHPSDPEFLRAAESPGAFDGKTITIRGWITLRHEDKNLWATWRDHENWETTRCISIINYDSLDDALDGKYVEVTGVMREDASMGGTLLRLASCRNAAIEVDGPSAVKPSAGQ